MGARLLLAPCRAKTALVVLCTGQVPCHGAPGLWQSLLGAMRRACEFSTAPAPRSLQAALGHCWPCAPWHKTGLLLGSPSCMLNTPAPCRILQPSALLCCKRGWGGGFCLQHGSGRAAGSWEAAGASPPPSDAFLRGPSPPKASQLGCSERQSRAATCPRAAAVH